MFRRDDLGDGSLIERHPIKGGVVPPGKGPLMIRAVAAHIAKGGVSREHEQESQSMGDKLALRFLGLRETTQYTLQQSHGPSFSVALDNTTLGDEDSCGYPSLKTVRSIVQKRMQKAPELRSRKWQTGPQPKGLGTLTNQHINAGNDRCPTALRRLQQGRMQRTIRNVVHHLLRTQGRLWQ